jgi:hypothetical protein
MCFLGDVRYRHVGVALQQAFVANRPMPSDSSRVLDLSLINARPKNVPTEK